MEKLLKLLNEYEWYTDIPTWTLSWANEPLYWWWTAYASAYLIPSKRYWFIKWLVDNDKIDFSLIPNKIKEIWIPMKINWEIKYWFDSSDYYWLLMLLSISDNPISDLISYLK